jgi:hypothetical protein
MSQDRAGRLAALAEAHAALEAGWLARAKPDPAKAAQFGPDYSLHYLDVDPPAAAEKAFQKRAAPAAREE